MGVIDRSKGKRKRIALMGNPNTGKTSLFNGLTGMRQRVGNYAGVTVEKKIGHWRLDETTEVELIDLPGTYSLSAHSMDERVAIDVLCGHVDGGGAPELVVVVVDVENLQRNLLLASQVADLEIPVVIALNCWDMAEKKGLLIDVALLQSRLGVPVVPTVATQDEGLGELAAAVKRALVERSMMGRVNWPDGVERGLSLLQDRLASIEGDKLTMAECQRLLFDRHSALLSRLSTPVDEAKGVIREARQMVLQDGHNPDAVEALQRYNTLHPLLADVIERQAANQRSRTESVDHLLLHRVWGLGIFVGLMYLVFQSVYHWAVPLMDLIEDGVGWLQESVGSLFEATPMLQSLLVDGVIGGVGAFVVFLPQILILFLFIALLEETGYLARASFLMDKLFQWCGLNGRSFVPLLSSYACAIPGIMAARTIADPKARLITIMIAPLMSCSARLPVYVLLIGAFIEPKYGATVAGTVLFAMHMVGALVAAPLAWLLDRVLSTKGDRGMFLMELPSYRVPRLKTVFWRMYESGKDFVVRAGTVIFAITVIIWALLYFPRAAEVGEQAEAEFYQGLAMEEGVLVEPQVVTERQLSEEEEEELEQALAAAYLENSYLGKAGKFIQPVFAPAGYDWRITVGVIASFPAREVIISTLGTIYSLGEEVDEDSQDLRSAMRQSNWGDDAGKRAGEAIFSLPVVLSLMVFFALCMQCGATVAVIARELNWYWAIGSFVGLTALAWVGAVLTFQLSALIF